METVKPAHIRPGDTIAIVSPASPPDPVFLDQGVRFLKKLGFRVVPAFLPRRRIHYLAGSDSERADELNGMIMDPAVKAIFCTRGGYGSARIAESIDYAALIDRPKIIAGFSDVSFLLNAIWAKTRMICFHGPMPAAPHFKRNIGSLIRLTSRPAVPARPLKPFYAKRRFCRSGRASGYLIGGCLSVFCSLIGTPYAPPLYDTILFLEEAHEAPYRIDRMMMHLKNAGVFDRINGLVLGDFVDCYQRRDDHEPTFDIDEIIQMTVSDRQFPVISHIPAGHGRINRTLPIGCRFIIDGEQLIQSESAVG